MGEQLKENEQKRISPVLEKLKVPDIILNNLKQTKLTINIQRPFLIFNYLENFSGWSIRRPGVHIREKEPEMYSKIKNHVDLERYSELAREFGMRQDSKNMRAAFQVDTLEETEQKLLKITGDLEKTKELMEIVSYVESNFEEKLDLDMQKLEGYGIAITELWKNKSFEIVHGIGRFLDLKPPENIDIFLTWVPGGFGGRSLSNGIIVEVGNSKVSASQAIDTIIHESMHYTEFVNKTNTKRLLEKLGLSLGGQEEMSQADSVCEAIFGIVSPMGLLSEHVGIINKRRDLDEELNRKDLSPVRRQLFRDQLLILSTVEDYFLKKVVDGKKISYADYLIPKIISKIQSK